MEENAPAFGRAGDLKQFFDWLMSEPQVWKMKLRVDRLFVPVAIDRIEAECVRHGISSPFKTLLNAEDYAAPASLSYPIRTGATARRDCSPSPYPSSPSPPQMS